MNRGFSFLKVLQLVLVLAPLQAQAVFACAMMDTVVQQDCCCDSQMPGGDCREPGCDSALEAGEGPCCEQSVEVGIDQEARDDTLVLKPDLFSATDPPYALISLFDGFFPPVPLPVQATSSPPPVPGLSGSDIWLTTQRLRI
ncbi:MAG: hypothetical protein WD448_09765 [Woeseia sp.]